MPQEKPMITLYYEWWLMIISDEVAAGVARGWDPPEWVKAAWRILASKGIRVSPSAHTRRRWERMRRDEKC